MEFRRNSNLRDRAEKDSWDKYYKFFEVPRPTKDLKSNRIWAMARSIILRAAFDKEREKEYPDRAKLDKFGNAAHLAECKVRDINETYEPLQSGLESAHDEYLNAYEYAQKIIEIIGKERNR